MRVNPGANPGTRGGTQLEVECLKGYETIKSLETTGEGCIAWVYYIYVLCRCSKGLHQWLVGCAGKPGDAKRVYVN